MEQGVNWAMRGTLACLASFLLYVYHKTSPVVFFFLNMDSPVFCSFAENPTEAYMLLSALLGCKSFNTRRVSFGLPRRWAISNEKWDVHFLNTTNQQLISKKYSLRYFKFH